MPRMPAQVELEDGWCPWVAPLLRGYRLGCCDCGLVHDLEFDIVRITKHLPKGWWESKPVDPSKFRVFFRARRNNRSTTLLRKSMKKKEQTETKQTRAINKAANRLSDELKKFAAVCETNGSPLKTVSFRWKPDSGEQCKMSVRYRRP